MIIGFAAAAVACGGTGPEPASPEDRSETTPSADEHEVRSAADPREDVEMAFGDEEGAEEETEEEADRSPPPTRTYRPKNKRGEGERLRASEKPKGAGPSDK